MISSIRNCIDKSPDTTCSTSDIACLCRASSSNFLPNLVTCIHDDCVTIDPSVLTGPLQLACNIAGAPIPDSIINEVKSKASSLAKETQTVTQTQEVTRVSSVLITTTVGGSTRTLIYPITIERTNTISGEPSTVTEASTTTATRLVPVVITTTDSQGSTYTTTSTTTATQLVPVPITTTITTTDSQGSTITTTETVTSQSGNQSGGGSGGGSNSQDSTTTILTSTTVAGQPFTTTTTGASQRTSQTNAPASNPTDSAPFTNTNVAVGLKVGELRSWLGLGIALIVGAMWF
jgi:hypothetical protein